LEGPVKLLFSMDFDGTITVAAFIGFANFLFSLYIHFKKSFFLAPDFKKI
jgi:hypothetical protein